ncbi:MAG: hypothetical protein ACREEM_22745 [Blastocatellia bacterium]
MKATAAPSAASRFAMAAPIPFDPPVTTATLPASFFEFVDILFLMLSRYPVAACVAAATRSIREHRFYSSFTAAGFIAGLACAALCTA